MELRHLRYFVAVGEDQHYGRAAQRLRRAQPAVSRQIQDLEEEIGFKLFERLPRGVKLSAGGAQFLEDARRILKDVDESAARAARVARGQSGTLRVAFTEDASWRGIVPASFRRFRERHPDVELQLEVMASQEQMQALRAGKFDAGFVYNVWRPDPELAAFTVAQHHFEVAVPTGHPLAKRKRLRLRDLVDAPFIWFPRSGNVVLYESMMRACFRGGLKSPKVVQEGYDESTALGLVATGLGVAWVLETARWRRPEGVVIRPVVDYDFPMPLSLVWRKDNAHPLLERFSAEVRRLLGVRAS
ncbi:MAG TPA: LysR family transcriptional regulator [Usitatibacter sp.]|jgi:DNA-binding transcriptional LysR family regulator|nr:LysR family transcriptional regulator [Usitatibacter sp.]